MKKLMTKEELDEYLLENEEAYIKMVSREQEIDCQEYIGKLYLRDLEKRVMVYNEKVSPELDRLLAHNVPFTINYSKPFLAVKKIK